MEKTITGSEGLNFVYLTKDLVSIAAAEEDSEKYLTAEWVNKSTSITNIAFTLNEYLPIVAAANTKSDCDLVCKKDCELDLTPMIYETTVKAEGLEYATQMDVADLWRCPTSGRKNLKGGQVAGITVGCVVFAALVVVVAIVAVRCAKQRPKK